MPSELPRLVTRVPNELNNKFLHICAQEERTASNMLALLVKDFVKQYESINGELITDPDGNMTVAKPKHMGKSSASRTG